MFLSTSGSKFDLLLQRELSFSQLHQIPVQEELGFLLVPARRFLCVCLIPLLTGKSTVWLDRIWFFRWRFAVLLLAEACGDFWFGLGFFWFGFFCGFISVVHFGLVSVGFGFGWVFLIQTYREQGKRKNSNQRAFQIN